MSINNLESKIEELKELENFMAEINEQAEAIRDTIKEEMIIFTQNSQDFYFSKHLLL